MPLFQLDPTSIAERTATDSSAAPPPTLAGSVVRGVFGFTLVSVAGFAPWPIFDRWLRFMGEMGLYLTCTAVFIGLSGIFLHRLIIGPGALVRFYKLFALAFSAYAIVWVIFWVALRGGAGEFTGLFGGTAAMGVVLAFAFDAIPGAPKVIAALFLTNAAGYYAGGWFEGKLAVEHRLLAMLLWALCYGIGFGAGLGAAFYFCQARARALLGQAAHRQQGDGGPASP